MADQTRLELFIDVLDKKQQRALAQASLKPRELIEAIIQEFGEIDYLSTSPDDYRLLKAEDRSPLDDDRPLGKQVANKAALILSSVALPVPAGAQPPRKDVYLREEATDTVYKLHWFPAIIGRPDAEQDQNELIAVNLAQHDQGLRVSRRHAQITEENGRYFIQSLSPNPTTIKDQQGGTRTLNTHKQVLNPGDTISLDASQINLKLIIHEQEGGG